MSDPVQTAREIVERYKDLPMSMSEHEQLNSLRADIAKALGGPETHEPYVITEADRNAAAFGFRYPSTHFQAATPDKEREDLGDRSFAASIEAQALRSIAEGNLGDGPGQANYERIKSVALSALSKARSAGPSKDERGAVIEECALAAERRPLGVDGKSIAKAIRALKHSPKAGQEGGK